MEMRYLAGHGMPLSLESQFSLALPRCPRSLFLMAVLWLGLAALPCPQTQGQTNLFQGFLGSEAESSATAPATKDVQLLLFTQTHCPPCQQIAPMINHLIANQYPIRKIDVAVTPQEAHRWNVVETPTLVVVADGREVQRTKGVVSANQVGKMLIAAGYPADLSVLTKPTFLSAVQNRLAQIPQGRRGHRGEVDTTDPRTSIPQDQWTRTEQQSLAATVRIKVRYQENGSLVTDFGTGTVIHRMGREILILTCGHVFRDSQGNAQIEVDLGFDGADSKVTVPGQLLQFDSGAPDVALVTAATDFEIQPVPLAGPDYEPAEGVRLFSVGCDQGKPATVRRGHYLSTSVCGEPVAAGQQPSGRTARKYDVSGRPVVGRSGGGLFTQDGHLIGVCNAAVIEDNRGVYSAIDNIHQLLTSVNAAHLFRQDATQVAVRSSEPSIERPAGPRFLPVLPGASDSELPDRHRLSPQMGPTMRGQSLR